MSATYGHWIEIWTILQKYAKPTPGQPEITNPSDIYAFTAAEHDIFYFPTTLDDLDPESEDGQRLIELGCFTDEDANVWAIYT